MGTVTVSLPADGSTGTVSQYNTPLTTVVNEFNGNIDNNNIKSAAAIATSKLADDGGIGSGKLTTGVPVQIVGTNFSAMATGTTLIPKDDTIPQITEGTEFMTQAITPKSATNRLSVEVKAMVAFTVGVNEVITALFQDTTANALAVMATTNPGNNYINNLTLTHDMVAGTTSATTFRVRIGPNAAGTVTFNGQLSARLFGGITISSIRIIEYKV